MYSHVMHRRLVGKIPRVGTFPGGTVRVGTFGVERIGPGVEDGFTKT